MPNDSNAAVTLREFVSTRVGPSISEPIAIIEAECLSAAIARSLPQLHGRALDLFLLFRQRFPLAVQQVDHRLQVGVLRLDFSAAVPIAKDLLGTEQKVISLALALRGGNARFEIGNLVVDSFQPLVAFLLFGTIAFRLLRFRRCWFNRLRLMNDRSGTRDRNSGLQ